MQPRAYAQMATCTMVVLVSAHMCKWAARGHTMLAVALAPPCMCTWGHQRPSAWANGAASACTHGQKGLLVPMHMGKWGCQYPHAWANRAISIRMHGQMGPLLLTQPLPPSRQHQHEWGEVQAHMHTLTSHSRDMVANWATSGHCPQVGGPCLNASLSEGVVPLPFGTVMAWPHTKNWGSTILDNFHCI